MSDVRFSSDGRFCLCRLRIGLLQTIRKRCVRKSSVQTAGRYTNSYNAINNFVPYTFWGAAEGNHEPRVNPIATVLDK